MDANTRTTISLLAGHVLTLTVPAGTTGSLVRLSDAAGGEPYAPVEINGADISVGPFATPRRYTINCDVGTLSFASAVADPELFARLADYTATADDVTTLMSLHISGAGAPVDYTDGSPPASGEGVTPKGALYSDTTNGLVYRNSGTLAEPIWTALGDAA